MYTFESLAEAIDIPSAELRRLAINAEEQYSEHARVKRGKVRIIRPPSSALLVVQRRILHLLRAQVKHSDSVHNRPGRSILSNVKPHLGGSRWVAKFDIENAFPSSSPATVRSALGRLLDPGLVEPIVRLCVLSSGLPQGAPTSGELLDIVLLQLDTALARAALRRRARYTRYVDDMAVSASGKPVWAERMIAQELDKVGLRLNHPKTAWWRPGKPATITGLLLGKRPHVTPSFRTRMRSSIEEIEVSGICPTDSALSSLRGSIAFLESVQPESGARLRRRLHLALSGLMEG